MTMEIDRLSALPDELIHQIQAHLQSDKQLAQSALLSKRWSHLRRSYPILIFEEEEREEYPHVGSPLERFARAASRDLSDNVVRAIRIRSRTEINSASMGAVLDLIAIGKPEEILLISDRNSLPELFPARLINSCQGRLRALELKRFELLESPTGADDLLELANLRVLNLRRVVIGHRLLNRLIAGAPLLESLTLRGRNVQLEESHHLDSMTRLRFLHLEDIRKDERIVNIMIAAAPLLESLTLMYADFPIDDMSRIRTLEVRNHANLRVLRIGGRSSFVSIRITGANSLETMSLCSSSSNRLLKVRSDRPLLNLKSLDIEDCYSLKGENISELVSISPSLQSLRLGGITGVHDELTIRSRSLEKLDLDWSLNVRYARRLPKGLLRIDDAPRLAVVRYRGLMGNMPDIARPPLALPLRRIDVAFPYYCEIDEVRGFLVELSLHFRFVGLDFGFFVARVEGVSDFDWEDNDYSLVLILECVVESDKFNLREFYDQAFSGGRFGSDCPRYLVVNAKDSDGKVSSFKCVEDRISDETATRKSWPNQLKVVEIVNTSKLEGGDGEMMDISVDMLSSVWLENGDRFRLIWRRYFESHLRDADDFPAISC